MTSRHDPRVVNRRLARAVGIRDLSDVREIVVTINPHSWPIVTIERHVVDEAGGLSSALSGFELVPRSNP